MARLHEGGDSLDTERDYLRRTLPQAFLRGVRATLRGRGIEHAARSGALVAGLAAAATGGAVESVSGLRQRGALAIPAPRPGAAR
jgi:hypothetical protein